MRRVNRQVPRLAPAALVAVMFATGLIPSAALATSSPTDGSAFTSTPAQGPTGTEIAVAGERCFLPGSTMAGDGVVVTLVHDGAVAASTTVPVTGDGRWAGNLPVPAGTAAAAYRVSARCASPGFEDVDPVVYANGAFTVTGEGEGAAPETITTPRFNGGIEGFGDYDGQSTCSPSTKPGMGTFRSLVMANYGGSDVGVGRACNVGATSEHKEGRAWDWGMNAGNAGDRARVADLMSWLFASDNKCNPYANARRLGIMYIIWNRQMFRLYDTARGWAPYSGSSPHTDHVHFSLTRAGGNGLTSYYDRNFEAPAFRSTDRDARDIDINDTWGRPSPGDFDGDGRDDLLWYQPGAGADYVWYGAGRGAFSGRQVNVSRSYVPLVGDFNADCVDDVFWYGPGAAKDYRWNGHRSRQFTGSEVNVGGTYDAPVVGDFNGDRADDILWYRPGPGSDVVWYGTIYGQFVGRSVTINGTYQPLSGDFDGDGPDDVFFYGQGTAPDVLWFGARSNGFSGATVSSNYDADPPIVGDYNGDQRDDIFWYGPGTAPDTIWLGTSSRSFYGTRVSMDGVHGYPAAGDFDGSGRDDILFHGDGTTPDRLWLY